MYGAIIGDLAGSIYEYDQTKEIKSIDIDEIIEDNAFYSDDTILTIAIAEAILNNCDYDKYLRKYVRLYSEYRPDFEPYFKNPFSPGLMKWAMGNSAGTSVGNGAMMRISPVGYLFNTEEDVIKNSKLATIPSHNSKEAIDSATKIALIIFYLRQGLSLDEIYSKLKIKLKYEPFTKFNTTCSETMDNCLYTLYNSNSFEDAIKKTIALGGDTDTNACIVGSMAEALYGINNELIIQANGKLPKEFVKVLSKTKRL
ncbi:MAG: ADP-ribosylglycohydrolase family protein [Bacilli bacterium]|nr:ADP-ribosylglycohydrolase family protein [Bacilli bacterium]